MYGDRGKSLWSEWPPSKAWACLPHEYLPGGQLNRSKDCGVYLSQFQDAGWFMKPPLCRRYSGWACEEGEGGRDSA